MTIRLTKHAALTTAERELPLEWIVRTVENPEWTNADPENPALTRSYRTVQEAGGRVLRVVHRPDNGDILVITAFLDRGAKR